MREGEIMSSVLYMLYLYCVCNIHTVYCVKQRGRCVSPEVEGGEGRRGSPDFEMQIQKYSLWTATETLEFDDCIV